MSKFVDITGNVYNRLTVLNEVLPRQGHPRWLCICICGNKKEIVGHSLKRGHTKSCGCLDIEKLKERSTTHGNTVGGKSTTLYKSWANMIQRSTNPNNPNTQNYLSRGIKVCNEWLKFETYQEWALNNFYQNTLELDRKNNNLGYFPENCHFVPQTINIRNRRSFKESTSKYVGVYFDKNYNNWKTQITVNKKKIYLGNYLTEIEAALTRDMYIKNNKLEGFTLNFI